MEEDKKEKQWSQYVPQGCSEFKIHVQEGVAGKESKESNRTFIATQVGKEVER